MLLVNKFERVDFYMKQCTIIFIKNYTGLNYLKDFNVEHLNWNVCKM